MEHRNDSSSLSSQRFCDQKRSNLFAIFVVTYEQNDENVNCVKINDDPSYHTHFFLSLIELKIPSSTLCCSD